MISLLLAAVLVTSVGQVLFCFVIWRYNWYHPKARAVITACVLISSFGGIWFLVKSLTGLEGVLNQATLYAVPQAIALCLILASRLHEVFTENNSQLSEVSNGIKDMKESDEDRFAEKEEEQGDVRRRLLIAEEKQNEKLDGISRKLKEIEEAIEGRK